MEKKCKPVKDAILQKTAKGKHFLQMKDMESTFTKIIHARTGEENKKWIDSKNDRQWW